jgi:hypothetical protein
MRCIPVTLCRDLRTNRLKQKGKESRVKLPEEQAKIVLQHWIYIIREFIKHDANPRMNRNSEVGSYIREAFGSVLPEKARQLEQTLKNSQRKLSDLKRFFIPPQKRPPASLEDITPLSTLKRFESMRVSSLSFTEWLRRPLPKHPGEEKKRGSERSIRKGVDGWGLKG